MVHTRFFECAKQVFTYQSELASNTAVIHGQSYSPATGHTAVFAAWYGLLKDKRQWRLDFTKALTRAFVVDLTQPVALV